MNGAMSKDDDRLAYLAGVYERNGEQLAALRELVGELKAERAEARYCRRLWLVGSIVCWYVGAVGAACALFSVHAVLAVAVLLVAVVAHVAAHVYASREAAPAVGSAGEHGVKELRRAGGLRVAKR